LYSDNNVTINCKYAYYSINSYTVFIAMDKDHIYFRFYYTLLLHRLPLLDHMLPIYFGLLWLLWTQRFSPITDEPITDDLITS